MKIIFCLNHFLPESLAGTEVYTFNLARSLQQGGVTVAVLIPNFDSTQDDTYSYEGIKVIKFSENSVNDRRMILGQTKPLGLKSFSDILINEKPDIVHFHELSAGRGIGIYHVRAVAMLEIKIFFTCHLSTYSCQTGNLLYKQQQLCDGLIRTHRCTACTYQARGISGVKATVLQTASKILYAARLNASNWNSSIGTALGFPFVIDKKKKELLSLSAVCNKIIVLTHWYRQILEANGVDAAKIAYCPQGLTGAGAVPLARTTSLPLRLVFIGRISSYKGVHLLLEAMQQLPSNQINATFYGPVTEDTYAADCVAMAKDMTNVQWKGSIASDKVATMLAEYDLLCLPSTFSEMSPLVIQEAFAAGLPVLASNVYGNAEQVNDGINGWLFEYKNVNSLTQKLRVLMSNTTLIDEARKNIPATKKFKEVAAQHADLYSKLLSSDTPVALSI